MRSLRFLAIFLLLSLAATAGARAGLVLVSSSAGESIFDVTLDGPDATGMTDYALLVHLSLPGVTFDTPAGSAPGPFTVLVNGTETVTVTITSAASGYVFSDASNFTANLINGATADVLDLVLVDGPGTYVPGTNAIARITFTSGALAGTLGGSIDSDPANLVLQDTNGASVANYDDIQEAVSTAPPLSLVLPAAAVPEPATLAAGLLGSVALALVVRRGRRA